MQTYNLRSRTRIRFQADILKSCYENRVNIVGLAGPSLDIFQAELWNQKSLSVILLDDSTRSLNNDSALQKYPYKLQVFLIIAPSSESLERTLGNIKDSVYWNHMASFLILSMPGSHSTCSSAFTILWTAWQNNLLHANFLCIHQTKGLSIYSYNPYRSYAPAPWTVVNTYSGKNNHPWTLFMRNYGEDVLEVCQELNFDKTQNLGGYDIRFNAQNTSRLVFWYSPLNKTAKNSFSGSVGKLTAILLVDVLNATPRMVLHENTVGKPKMGAFRNTFTNIINGVIDIDLNQYFQKLKHGIPMTYPIFQSGLAILTQDSVELSQLQKIYHVIDGPSRIGICVVLAITLIFFKFFLRYSLGLSTLNCIRLICNMCLPNLPKTPAARIFLTSLFLHLITIQGIYQGEFAKILTTQARSRRVDSIDDLADQGHTIYGHHTYGDYFMDPMFKNRFVGLNDTKCSDYVMRDTRAACVRQWLLLVEDAVALNYLHLARHYIFSGYMIFVIRPDWPLEQRINQIFVRMREMHLTEYWEGRLIHDKLNLFLSIKNLGEIYQYKPITLPEMYFAFAILAIGLTFAFVSFTVEVAIGRIPSRIVKV